MIGNGPSKAARGRAAARPGTVARPPTQARGLARVDTILNAAAGLITDDGLAGVTMHALARRSRTSIGSLYHFFPDRESVLDALRQRHLSATRDISQRLGSEPAEAWRKDSAGLVIERVVTPFVTYLRGHADYLQLMRERMSEEDGADFIHVIRRVLEARLPELESDQRDDYVLMLHLIASGVMNAGLQVDPGRAEVYLREIPRAMTAYLETIEAALKR
jgi:AcrR family transcriptional regulator